MMISILKHAGGGVTGVSPVREGSDQRSGREGRDFSLLNLKSQDVVHENHVDSAGVL